jgi:hypothetical protein
MAEDIESEALRFSLQVRLTHPSIDPEVISRALRREADVMWKAGDERRTPTGQRLPGTRKETYWSRSHRVARQRRFFDAVSSVANQLADKAEFFRDFHQSGGEATLVVDLPGDVNIGDVMSAANLRLIAEAGFGLGIEVFPKLP